MSSFTITTPETSVNLRPSSVKSGETATGTATYSVTNKTGATIRTRLRIEPGDGTNQRWFTIRDGDERDIAPGATVSFSVDLAVPGGAAHHSFRAVAVNLTDPDNDFETGSTIAFDAPELVTNGPPPPPPPWRKIAVAIAVLLVVGGGVVIYIILSGNSAPTAIALDRASVNENTAGAVVGALTVADPDVDDTHTFTVDDDRFEVSGGQLKLKDDESLDHQTESSVPLTITAADQDGARITEAFTITVKDVNAPPTEISLDKQSVKENVKGAVVGTLSATDPDPDDTFSFSVDDSRFEVDGARLKLKNDKSLDHEAESEVALEITAADQEGEEMTKSFTIAVTDVDETPAPTPPKCPARTVKVPDRNVKTSKSDAKIETGDNELGTDDWTAVEVSYRVKQTADKRGFELSVDWTAQELNRDKSNGDTRFRSRKTFSLFRVESSCPGSRIIGFDLPKDSARRRELYKGKVHGFKAFPNTGNLRDILVQIDGPGKNDDQRQALRGQFKGFPVTLSESP